MLEYFRERPDDLLVLRLTEGEGWEKLCPFLDAPIPDTPFPHANSVAERNSVNRRLRQVLKRILAR